MKKFLTLVRTKKQFVLFCQCGRNASSKENTKIKSAGTSFQLSNLQEIVDYRPVVVDLEATTETSFHEIIQIGACELHPVTFEVVSTFQSFVRPSQHPQLSAHCISLTNITQEMVSNADNFSTVWANFNDWLASSQKKKRQQLPNKHSIKADKTDHNNTTRCSTSSSSIAISTATSSATSSAISCTTTDDADDAVRDSHSVVLCGWSPFDWWWLRDECFRHKVQQPYSRYRDVMEECIAFNGSRGRPLRRMKLSIAALSLGVVLDESKLHDALYDAQVTADVLRLILSLPSSSSSTVSSSSSSSKNFAIFEAVLNVLQRRHPEPVLKDTILKECSRSLAFDTHARRYRGKLLAADRGFWVEKVFAELERLGYAKKLPNNEEAFIFLNPRCVPSLRHSFASNSPVLSGKTVKI